MDRNPDASLRPTFPWKLALALFFSGAFAMPLILNIAYRADPLTIANESLAYRFLFSERLLNGEGSSVWVLAGFLTTAIQTTILKVINLCSAFPQGDLQDRTHWFAYLFTGGIVVSGVFVYLTAAAQRSMRIVDLALLGLVGLGPLYVTRTIGFYYYSLPDYYHLNVLLALLAVWFFQLAWHCRECDLSPSYATLRVILAGLFTGAICANKVTMAIIAVPLLLAVVFRRDAKALGVVRDTLLALAACVIGFLFVIWWFYLFKFSAVRGMFGVWIATIRNPGGESSFWSSDFRNYLTSYSYGYIIAFYLFAVAVAMGFAVRASKRSALRFGVLTASLAGGVAWTYFVMKRPAGTTFFEGAVALMGLSGIALTTITRQRFGTLLVGLVAFGWTCFAVCTFQLRESIDTMVLSKPWADEMWRLHRELLEFAKGRAIVVIHPRNEYGYGGVEEFLLKGTADVQTWNVSANGRPILDRYAPRMTFRHEYGTNPNAPFPAGAVVFWVDRPEFPPLVERYSLLKAAVHRTDTLHRDWAIMIQDGHTLIRPNAILLADNATP